MLYRVHLAWAGFELPTLVVIAQVFVFQLPYDHTHDGPVKGNYYEKTILYYKTPLRDTT